MSSSGIRPFESHTPSVADGVFLAAGSHLIGDVQLEKRVSIWFNAVLRGDSATIEVGEASNIQDGCVLHADPGFPVRLGRRVTVGHRAIVHGAVVEDESLIGMGAILLNGCMIGKGSMVAAGTVVLEGEKVPPGSLVAGVPGKVRRSLTPEEQQRIRASAANYVERARRYGPPDPTRLAKR